jgi:hypothetical protein
MSVIPRSTIVMSSPAALKRADRVSFGTSRNQQHRLVMRNDKDGINLRQRAENSIGAVVKAQNSKVDLI